MALPRSLLLAAALSAASPSFPFASPLPAQTAAPSAPADSRIWGRVHTLDGKVHQGYLQFGRGWRAVSWDDVLRLERDIPDRRYHTWLQAVNDGLPTVRTVEVEGYRVSWEERHRDFADASRVVVRVGRLEELVVYEGGAIGVVHRDGGGAWTTNGGGGSLRVTVSNGTGEAAVVRGEEIARVEFAAAPGGSDRFESDQAAPSARVRASVRDRFGRTFAGLLSFGGAPVFASDELAGEDEGGSRTIRWRGVAEFEPRLGGAQVTLRNGSAVELFRRGGSAWYRRSVRIADPGLGGVRVDWDDVRAIRTRAGGGTAREELGGGAPLYGVVIRQDGERLEGWIRWDADREWTWEHLTGESDNADLAVEFGHIERIERDAAAVAANAGSRAGGWPRRHGALVTLTDGRRFHMTGSPDVNRDNRGIFVFSAPPGRRPDSPYEGWRHVAWEDFREARFGPAPPTGSPEAEGARR